MEQPSPLEPLTDAHFAVIEIDPVSTPPLDWVHGWVRLGSILGVVVGGWSLVALLAQSF